MFRSRERKKAESLKPTPLLFLRSGKRGQKSNGADRWLRQNLRRQRKQRMMSRRILYDRSRERKERLNAARRPWYRALFYFRELPSFWIEPTNSIQKDFWRKREPEKRPRLTR